MAMNVMAQTPMTVTRPLMGRISVVIVIAIVIDARPFPMPRLPLTIVRANLVPGMPPRIRTRIQNQLSTCLTGLMPMDVDCLTKTRTRWPPRWKNFCTMSFRRENPSLVVGAKYFEATFWVISFFVVEILG
jgi:hypothetical protein